MDIINTPQPVARPCALPHTAPTPWLAAEPEPAPAADPPPPDIHELRRAAIQHHMDELERLGRDLGEQRKTPVGGWTPFNRKLFLSVLSTSGRISYACEIVQLSKQSAYALRARDPIFAAGWNAAAELARDALADEVMDRALAGTTETITRNGEVVAERHRHDSRLAMAVLARLDRRCDRSAEEAGHHRRAMAEWDRFLDLVGEGEDTAAAELLTPPPPPETAIHGQPSQPIEDDDEVVWRSHDGEWRTSLAHPGGDVDGIELFNGRACTEEEAALLDACYGGEEDLATEREEERVDFFASLQTELDAVHADLAQNEEPSSTAGDGPSQPAPAPKLPSLGREAAPAAGKVSDQGPTGSLVETSSPPDG